MNRIAFVFILSLLVAGCASSTRLLQRGDYDRAVEKAVGKLRKNPGNEKEVQVLERAYRISNEQNLERIRYLKMEGRPANMPEIVSLYTRLSDRQALVRTVTPLTAGGRTIQFPYVDFHEEIIAARSGAAAFHYGQAVELMAQHDKQAYREAYGHLLQSMEFGGDYLNARELAAKARQEGISRALVSVYNHTHLNLPQGFVDQLLLVDTRGMDTQWVEFHYRDLDERLPFDYFIDVNLRVIDVSPNQVSEKDRLVSKRIEDGFDYARDARGNVLKDSLGNDIKITKYKEISCALIETLQQKSARIEGDIEFFSEQPRRLLRREPVGSATTFEHHSARAIGDIRALDEEDREMAGREAVPFPGEPDMIMRTADGFRQAIAEAIRKNRKLIQ
jgi:hypothetical protein